LEEYILDKNLEFDNEVAKNIAALSADEQLKRQSLEWSVASARHRYTYNFRYLGRPIIQFPQDIIAMQELIWQVKPDLIIETGIAHGGSLTFSASMLALLDYCEAVETGKTLDPRVIHRRVLGLDIDIRPHNRAAIEAHPMAHRIVMIQGSSIAPEVIAQVNEFAKGFEKVLVSLDSNHTHEHVFAELEAYAPIVSKDSYCVVFDTVIEDMPDNSFPDRPWGKGNNPKTAVWEFLKQNDRFIIDKDIENKLLITVAPDGYLKCIKD
jgi:cephalosporin hydroxylase